MPSALIMLSARGGGDRPPVIALAIGLNKKGWNVTVLCDEETDLSIKGTGLDTVIFSGDLDQKASLRAWSNDVRSTDPPRAENVSNPLLNWGELLLPISRETIKKTKPDIIISALFTMGLAELASKSDNVPWCIVNPSFYFGKNLEREWEDDWYPPVIPLFAEHVLNPLVEKADLALHATDEKMDFKPDPMPENHHYVGFLLWEPRTDLPQKVLDSERPWRLITTSTEPQREEIDLVEAAIHALEDLPGTTILTLPDQELQAAIGNVPDNVLMTGFLPHTPIIKESELVISHAGHGIVSKSLYYGIPMLLLPWDRDQPGVAARAARLGSSIAIERSIITPGSVKSAAKELLQNHKFNEISIREANRLQNFDSVKASIRRIEAILN